MKQWTIGKRLISSFLLVTIVIVLLGAVSYYSNSKGQASIQEITEEHLPASTLLWTIKANLGDIAQAQQAMLDPNLDAAGLQKALRDVDEARKRYRPAMEGYEKLPRTPAQQELWSKFGTVVAEWREENNKFFEMTDAIEKAQIAKPSALDAQLAMTESQQNELLVRLLNALRTKKNYIGDEESGACGLGKWLVSFKPQNQQLIQSKSQLREPHDRLHASIKKMKQLLAGGDVDGASRIYDQEVAPSQQQVLQVLKAMRDTAGMALQLGDKAAVQAVEKVFPAKARGLQLIGQMVELNDKLATEGAEEATAQSTFFTRLSMISAIGGVILASLLALLMTRSIGRILSQLALGLNQGAEQVSAAAGQVSSASQSLAEGATEQASSLEETSSALEEMAAMTRTNAGNAKEATGLAEQARGAANEGDKTVARLNEAMVAINDSSEKIGRIIKVIEEIAFQTNLLALNAAVEAARAGEHGKGFAVVADEVRNLAQRAAQAARETTTLIEDAVNRVKGGTEAANAVGKSLGSIVSSVSEVARLITGISEATDQQAQGTDQINTAVSQMDRVTQQTAAGAEEAASASEQLSAQAETLKSMVNDLVALVGGRARKNTISTDGPATPEISKRQRKPVASGLAHKSVKNPEPPQTGKSDDLSELVQF